MVYDLRKTLSKYISQRRAASYEPWCSAIIPLDVSSLLVSNFQFDTISVNTPNTVCDHRAWNNNIQIITYKIRLNSILPPVMAFCFASYVIYFAVHDSYCVCVRFMVCGLVSHLSFLFMGSTRAPTLPHPATPGNLDAWSRWTRFAKSYFLSAFQLSVTDKDGFFFFWQL